MKNQLKIVSPSYHPLMWNVPFLSPGHAGPRRRARPSSASLRRHAAGGDARQRSPGGLVRAIGPGNGTHSGWLSDSGCNLGVAPGLALRDGAQRLPDAFGEARAVQDERRLEVGTAQGKERFEFAFDLCGRRMPSDAQPAAPASCRACAARQAGPCGRRTREGAERYDHSPRSSGRAAHRSSRRASADSDEASHGRCPLSFTAAGTLPWGWIGSTKEGTTRSRSAENAPDSGLDGGKSLVLRAHRQ